MALSENKEKKERRKRIAIGASVAAVFLLLALGVAANASMFMTSFDPSSFLDGGLFGRSELASGDDSTYLNDDVKSADSADVPGEGRDKDEETQTPENASDPDAGQGAAVSAAQLSENANPNAGTVVSPVNNGNGAANSDANPNGPGQPGENDGNNVSPANPANPANPVQPGGSDPEKPGNDPTNPTTPDVDEDRPPEIVRPAAMGGVTLLQLNQSGSAVFSTKNGKDTIDPTQNLDGLKIIAVLYDSRTGTKWTRTLTYGNVDGYTYTIASSCFPLTSETTKITLVYYLYGNRYTVDVPCKVSDKLVANAEARFFDYLNVGQNVSQEELAKHLSVTLSDSPVDLSLCKVTGFDTSQKPGTYTATVSYAGLSATFKYTLNEVAVNFHTPEALLNCEERGWGHMNGWSPTGMTTRFNGTEKVSETLTTSMLDVTTYSQQLMGDLYWTQDCDGILGLGTDPNFTTTYAMESTAGQLENWFVGWATADPSKAGGAVDSAWLQAHLVDSQLSAEDIAAIAKEQGSGGSVDLYPVMRIDTTIPADGYVVKYNEVSFDYAGWNDSLEYRQPAQMLASFTNDAVSGGMLDVPAGVTYVSLSPFMIESQDTSAYESVEQLKLPIGIAKVDQVYPQYGWPYYSDKCGSGITENVLPNVASFELSAAAASHGGSSFRTCIFDLERENGSKSTLAGLVDSSNELVALPTAGAGKNDTLKMAEDSGVTVIAAVAISHMEAKSIEFASSVEQINTGALTSSRFDTIILNSAPTIMGEACCGVSRSDTFEERDHAYTTLVLRSTDVPDLQYGGWRTFFNKEIDEWYWDDEAMDFIHVESSGDDSYENLKAEGIHIVVPNQETLVRCYSAWAEMIDGTYVSSDGEGDLEAPPATAFLLRVAGDDKESQIYTDGDGVVFLRGDDGDTLLYAPPTLSGYYMIPEAVTAIAPSAFAECSQLEGVIINPRASGKLPTLGEYAFGNPDDNGYAAPPDTLKIYISSELAGESDWRSALESQYWHTSDQDKADNASLLVDMTMESGYESYLLDSGSLYASTGETTSSGDDALALLRANESSKGIFEMPAATVKIGAFAFAGCEGITSLANIDNVTEIGDTAFLDCKNLNVLALPAGLESLGDSAFLGCSHLEAIAFNNVPDVGADLFDQASTPRVFLPSSANDPAGKAASMKSSLEALGVQEFTECAYSDGVYSLMHDTPSWTGYISYYRGLYTQSAAEGAKQVSFAGSRLGDASMGDDTQSVNLDEEVIEIADGVFANQPLLQGVYGGDCVTKIGDGAFKDCAELRDVSLGSFDSKVVWVGDDAFSGCANLVTFAVPYDESTCVSGTFHVGDRAFAGCVNLEITGYGSDFFTQDFVMPIGVDIEIGEEAFEGCTKIPRFPLSSGNVSIGERAFAGCTSLTQITISSSRADAALSIGKDAFCDSPLAFVNLAGGQVNVESGALSGASDMCALFVSDGANVAGDAFPAGAVSKHVIGACPAGVSAGSTYDTAGADGILPSVTSEYASPDTFVAVQYPSNGFSEALICSAGNDIVEFISYSLPDGSYILGDGAFKNSQSLERVSFAKEYGWSGGQVISLGNEAFKGCVNLTNTGLEFEDYGYQSPVVEIGESCFEGCTSLTNAGMGMRTPLQTIGKAAFKDCTGITQVDIPFFTTSVGDQAFMGCTSLVEVDHWWATDARYSDCTLGASAFEGCTSLEVYEAPGYLNAIGSDCFKGCDKLTLKLVWTGDPDDPSTSNLPTLAAHPFGANADGSDLIPDADRIMIVYENILGGAVDTDAAGIAGLFTKENGWLPFVKAFTYVDADGNLTTNTDEEAAGDEEPKDGDEEAAAAKEAESADKEAGQNTVSLDDDATSGNEANDDKAAGDTPSEGSNAAEVGGNDAASDAGGTTPDAAAKEDEPATGGAAANAAAAAA